MPIPIFVTKVPRAPAGLSKAYRPNGRQKAIGSPLELPPMGPPKGKMGPWSHDPPKVIPKEKQARAETVLYVRRLNRARPPAIKAKPRPEKIE